MVGREGGLQLEAETIANREGATLLRGNPWLAQKPAQQTQYLDIF